MKKGAAVFKVYAIVYAPKGLKQEAKTEYFNPPKKMSLLEAQKVVKGYLERLPCNDPDYALIVNEDGNLTRMPENPEATALVRDGIMGNTHIKGNALLVDYEV